MPRKAPPPSAGTSEGKVAPANHFPCPRDPPYSPAMRRGWVMRVDPWKGRDLHWSELGHEPAGRKSRSSSATTRAPSGIRSSSRSSPSYRLHRIEPWVYLRRGRRSCVRRGAGGALGVKRLNDCASALASCTGPRSTRASRRAGGGVLSFLECVSQPFARLPGSGCMPRSDSVLPMRGRFLRSGGPAYRSLLHGSCSSAQRALGLPEPQNVDTRLLHIPWMRGAMQRYSVECDVSHTGSP